jgi:hypothetical protein
MVSATSACPDRHHSKHQYPDSRHTKARPDALVIFKLRAVAVVIFEAKLATTGQARWNEARDQAERAKAAGGRARLPEVPHGATVPRRPRAGRVPRT